MCASPCAPKKKRKIESAISVPSLPETWETLVKVLPEGMTQDFQELPNLLEKMVGSLSAFKIYPEHLQKLSLINALGDKSPLVAAIMECVEASAGGPGSYVDQALNCELPPSTQLNHEYVVAVLNAILGQEVMDLRGLCNYFDSKLSTSSTSTSSVSSEVSSETFRAYYQYTLYLGDKEASARGILGLFMELVRGTLQKRHPKQNFYIDHELKVLRFSSDAALIVASTGQQKRKVVFSLEYKPKMSPQLKDQHPFHISELFLQAFYLAT